MIYRIPFLLLLLAGVMAAEPLAWAEVASQANWKFVNPKDFPGATGSMSMNGSDLVLAYDFTGGGNFVGLLYKGPVPAEVGGIAFTLTASVETQCKFRLQTVDGRTFQGFETRLPAGEAVEVVLPTDRDWAEAWGGGIEAKTPQTAIKTFHLLANKKAGNLVGTVTASSFHLVPKGG
jgi:hypothetical protein